MQNRTRLGLAAALGATALFVACSSNDSNNGTVTPGGGSGGASGGAGGTAGSTVGGSSAGTTVGGSAAGTTVGGVAGGGSSSGGAGTAGVAGTAGTGTAGTGGTPPVINPTVFLIDNVRLQLKGQGDGGQGAGGQGAGGAADSLGGEGGQAVGGAGPDVGFIQTFDAGVAPLAFNPNGFSPGPGGSMGPPIIDNTLLTFDAANGKPGGAVKVSVPFTVAMQQADISSSFATPQNLTGYELLADVKMIATGDVGTCATAWLYVYGGNGYANDKSGEPASGQTSHLVKDVWKTVRLDLDGPYGFHSSVSFKPELVNIWGIQLNTWGCP